MNKSKENSLPITINEAFEFVRCLNANTDILSRQPVTLECRPDECDQFRMMFMGNALYNSGEHFYPEAILSDIIEGLEQEARNSRLQAEATRRFLKQRYFHDGPCRARCPCG